MFAQRLRSLRKSKGLTQESLGKIVGISKQAIHSYEKDERHPGFDILSMLANFFDVSTDYLLGRTDITNFHGQSTPPPDPEALARESILHASDLPEALLRLSAWSSEFNASIEEFREVLKEIHKQYGDLPKRGGKAAHGPAVPGTGALR